MRSFVALPALWSAVSVLLGVACDAGPTPRNASNPPDVTIHNTAAIVENVHAVTTIEDSPASLAVLAQADRDPRDRQLDERYQGADLLTFLGIRPGMRVGELAAGGGYVTELLARGVGARGTVFANEPPSLAANTHASVALNERLQRRADLPIARADRELASPLPGNARDLDLVYLELPYRTAEAVGVRTAAMNAVVYDALVSGGKYVVLDYRPRVAGPVPIDLHAWHAEESANVRRQIEAAGFHFVTEGRFLRNDPNPTEWDAVLAPNPTTVEQQDRFLLEFVKP